MKHRRLPAAFRPLLALVALAAAGAAPAQQNWIEIEDELAVVQSLAMTVEELDGVAVHNPQGERIGQLDDVLQERGGEAMAVSLDVGGFLGIGEKDVLIPVDDLTASAEGIVIDMTKAQLEALPAYRE